MRPRSSVAAYSRSRSTVVSCWRSLSARRDSTSGATRTIAMPTIPRPRREESFKRSWLLIAARWFLNWLLGLVAGAGAGASCWCWAIPILLLRPYLSVLIPPNQRVPDFSSISNLSQHVGTTVTVRGWVSHLRSSGKIAFIVIRDGSGLLQAVLVKSQVSPETWESFSQLTQETSIAVTGEVRAEPRAPGGYEMGVASMQVLGSSPIDYPIQPKEHGVDFLLDNRHLWLRSARQVAILRVRHEIEQAIHDF